MKRIYVKHLSFFRILFFYIIIFPLDARLNLLKAEDTKFLNENYVKELLNLRSFSELSSLFLKLAKNGKNIEENIIKATWCISLKEDNKYNIEYLLDEIKTINIDKNKLYRLMYSLSIPFVYRGDYFRLEELEKKLILIIDKKNDQKPSLINENQHFTALGHISLIFFLIKAINSKLVDSSKSSISLIYNPQKVANLEYANLIAKLCPNYGIKIINYKDIKEDYFRPNLELWPSLGKNNYLLSRNFYGHAFSEEINKKNKLFLKPESYHLDVAKNIIKKLRLPINKWFVGMHLRYAKDGEELKNPSPIIFQRAIDHINKRGGSVILVGSRKNKIYSSLTSVINITKLPISQYERECLSIYVWSKSKFFVGSLSGGSFPPTTFGVKILWLDIYPTLPFRPPNDSDICLPKRIFYKHENRYLSFEESNSKEHYLSQTEFPEVAKKNGYKIESVNFDIVEKALEELITDTKSLKHFYLEETHPVMPIGARIFTQKINP